MRKTLPHGKRLLLVTFLSSLVTLFASCASIAGEDPVYTSLFSNKAVGGYDVTAYFSENKAVEGKEKFSLQYKGATWRFVSQQNLEKFKADPQRYAPQYGGYCAWATAKGDLQKGDPERWDIHDGKLYLNFDDQIQQAWRSNKQEFIARADEEWPAILEN